MKRALHGLIFLIVAAAIVIAPLAYITWRNQVEQDRINHQEIVDREIRELQDQLDALEIERRELRENLQEADRLIRGQLRTYYTVTPLSNDRQMASRYGGEGETALTMPVLSESFFTAEMYERAWERLGQPSMAGTGEALIQAEEEWGVNSLVLAAIAVHESWWGKSKIARDKNNLLGLGAFDSDPYRYAFTFEHKNDSILYAAELLAVHYLTPEGRWHSGPDLRAINVRYATSKAWAGKVAVIMGIIAEAAIEEPGDLVAVTEKL